MKQHTSLISLALSPALWLIPFGGIYAGLLTDTAGVLVALGVTAVLYGIAALSPAIIPAFRTMGDRPAAQPAN